MLYEPLLRGNLLRVAKAYAAARNIELTTVGRKFCGSDRFFDRITSGGCSFTVLQYDKIMGKFSLDWPHGTDWPANVERPNTRQIARVRQRQIADEARRVPRKTPTSQSERQAS